MSRSGPTGAAKQDPPSPDGPAADRAQLGTRLSLPLLRDVAAAAAVDTVGGPSRSTTAVRHTSGSERRGSGSEQGTLGSGSASGSGHSAPGNGHEASSNHQKASSSRQKATGNDQGASGGRQEASGSRQEAPGSHTGASGSHTGASCSRQRASGGRQEAAGSSQEVSGIRQRASARHQEASDNSPDPSDSRQEASGSRQGASGGRPQAFGSGQETSESGQASGSRQEAHGSGAHVSASHLSVGEQLSQLSLGEHSVGEDVSVDRQAEEGEMSVCRPVCNCTVCAARTRVEPSTQPTAADLQLKWLCQHTVDMMKMDGASEQEKRLLVQQLQRMVPPAPLPQPAAPFPFEHLPTEIQLHVLSFLSPRELCNTVVLVCRQWLVLAKDALLWQHLSFETSSLVSCRNVVHILSYSHLLKSLRLEGHRHADKILFQVADTCKQLRALTAKFCDGLSSLVLEVIVKHCPLVERVNLEGSRFEDAGCTSALAGLSRLRALNVSHCARLEDAELVELAVRCRHLEELNVDGIGYVTDAAVLRLVDLASSRLTSLVLDGEHLTDAAFMAVARCRHLQVLSISFADCMSDAGLSALRQLGGLLRLKIKRGQQLSSGQLSALFARAGLPLLLHLDLSECSNLDDATVDAVTANCPLLTFLALNWCWDVTEAGLEAIVARLRFMRVLELIGVVRITGSCLRHIPERLPELRFLNLEQCTDIEDVVVERVVRRRPQLQALDYYGDRVVPRPEEMERWPDEVGDSLTQLQLPLTINFGPLDGVAGAPDA